MSSPIADNKMLGRKLAKIIVIFNIISEWRVKVVGNQSCVRLGIINRKGRFAVASTLVILGPEVLGSLPNAQTVPPHWSNMSED